MKKKKIFLKRVCACVISSMLVLPYFSVGMIWARAEETAVSQMDGNTVLFSESEKNGENTVVSDETGSQDTSQTEGDGVNNEDSTEQTEGTGDSIGSENEKTEEEKLKEQIDGILKDKIKQQLEENTKKELSPEELALIMRILKMKDLNSEESVLIIKMIQKAKLSSEEILELMKMLEGLEKPKEKKEQKSAIENGDHVIEVECFDASQPGRFSMANTMFAKEVDMRVQGAVTQFKFYVPYPVPAFPALGADGTIKDFYLEYENKKYQAKSDITAKPLKPMRETNPGFGLVKDKPIPTQVLTVEIPTSAISGKELMFKAGGYVNVVMNKDVELLVKLSKIPAVETMVPLFWIDGKEVMVPNWLANTLKSGKLIGFGNNSNNNNSNTNSGNNAAGNNSNTNNSTTLADGVYSVTGNVLKAGGSGYSMANDAVDHTMYIAVKGGKANLILTFKGLALNGMQGYLGYLNYFENMNSNTPYKSEVLSVQKANGVAVSDMYGTNYPKDIMFPLPSEAMSTGKVSVQVFVPIMESLSAGNGTQKAILELSVNNLSKITDNADTFINARKEGTTSATTNQTTNNAQELKLNDGIYKASISMLKTDKTSLSMANNSVNHIAKIRVEGGKYYLTLRFNPMDIGGKSGYLGRLKFYTPSYTLNNGDITGTLKESQIEEYHTKDGKNVTDVYGKDYPKACTVEIIESARKDGFVALNVFVPVMDKISKGAGNQNVFAKIDIGSVVKTHDSDPDFLKENGNSTGTDTKTLTESDSKEDIIDRLSSEKSETTIEDSKVALSQITAPNGPIQRTVTQYIPVSSSQPQQSQEGQSNEYTAFPQMNPYYQNAYMYYPNQYINPYYMNQGVNPYYQDMRNENSNNKADAEKESKQMTTIASVIIGGMSGIGTALGIVFKKFL